MPLTRKGVAVTFYAQYIASKVGKTGLSVTVDVYEKAVGGSPSQIVSDGAASAVGGGLYYYELASGSVDASGEYLAVFKTSDGTVDQQHIPAIWCTDKRVNSQVEAMDADTLNATALAANAVTEIQTGLATAAALTAIGDRLPAALVGGRMDAAVGAMGADTLNAAALATDAVAEIQAGLATTTGLSLVGATVNSIDSRIPAALDGGLMPAVVADYGPGQEPATPAEIADAVLDEPGAGHNTPGTLGAVVNQSEALALEGTAQAGSTASSVVGDSGLSAVNDFYNGAVLVFTSGDLRTVARRITDYTGATRAMSLAVALPAAPAPNDTFIILGRIDQ